jgi:hypothetical protein
MEMRHLSIIAVILSTTAGSYADSALSQSDAQGILHKLSATPTRTWISAGTIVATHEQYRAARMTDAAQVDAEVQRQVSELAANPSQYGQQSPDLQKLVAQALPFNVRYEMANEYTMTSNVTVKYDGDRFYWDVDVTSRNDSVSVPSDMQSNPAARCFNMSTNGHRVFAWDGQTYTLYSASKNHAIVDAAGMLDRAVNGPLTAGVIPWGSGKLTADALNSAAIPSAAQVTLDGATQVQMTIQPADGSTMTVVLDPAKDYAVTSCTWRGNSSKTRSAYYSNHQKVSGKWVPMTILVEWHDLDTGRLLESDKWDIQKIDPTTPHDFSVAFATGTKVEHMYPGSSSPAAYTYSKTIDMNRLLTEHIALTASRDKVPQNCATAALKYTAAALGKPISDKTLAGLVGSNGETSLAALLRAARNAGLKARAVETDVATLKTLDSCKAILYMPAKSHFVALDSISGPDAWLVDLGESRFCYRTSTDLLPTQWSGGVAILVSTRPVEGAFRDIDRTRLAAIAGGHGRLCNTYLQAPLTFYCQPDSSGSCFGVFRRYFEHWGCGPARIGTCTDSDMLWWYETGCAPDPFEPNGCGSDGDYTFSWILACA